MSSSDPQAPKSKPASDDAQLTSADTGIESQGASSSEDVVLIRGRLPDSPGLAVLRKRQDRIEAGAVLPLKAGQPIHGEVVRLTPRKEFPLLCDVQVDYAPTAPVRPTSKGPGQFATEQYRRNWDAIWQRAPTGDESLN